MRAFVTEIAKFFKLNTERSRDANFESNRRALRIPLYQREYKWEDEKIEALISDISKRDKFLGNIIVDEVENSYEIVDGQQRITTCYLLLVYLFNYYRNSQLEQESIRNILKPYGEFILHNESVGQYLSESPESISIQISCTTDVYFQKDDFERAYSTISAKLSGIITSAEDAREFKRKLLNSKVLVLINEPNQPTATEQIFLDINEKAQLLDIEDIFKGHCFEIFDAEFHARLRQTWVNLKRCAAKFKTFGAQSLSDYIYWFLLEHDNNRLPKKLNPDGRHYLEGKTMDETNILLQQMIAFGESVITFSENITKQPYRFIDICENSSAHQYTPDHISLKAMSSAMLLQNKTLYQKLPFMYFLYTVLATPSLQQELTHDNLRRIVTNLYVYTSLFSLNPAKKKKELIDHTIRDALRVTENRSTQVVRAAKDLRIAAVGEYQSNSSAKFDELETVYSIMDNYVANTNWIPLVYSRDTGYNLEHFVIPDTRTAKIKWTNGTDSFLIELDREYAKANKKKACNHLIINYDLNEAMENYDIFTKLEKIRSWHTGRNLAIPKHVAVFISRIESMPEFQRLQEYRSAGETAEVIIPTYKSFIEAYFTEENQDLLFAELEAEFKRTFQN